MHPLKKMILSLCQQDPVINIGYCYFLTILDTVDITNIGVRYSAITDISEGAYIYRYASLLSLPPYTDGGSNLTYYLCSLTNPAIVHMDTLIPFIWSEGSFYTSGGTCVDNGECVIP